MINAPPTLPDWVTPERKAYLELHYPTRMGIPQLYGALCCMPGPFVPSLRELYGVAKMLGVSRRNERAYGDTSPYAKSARQEKPMAAIPVHRTPVTFDELRVHASSLGVVVRDWEDMPKVNEAAEARRLAGFKRDFTREKRRG